MRALNVLLAVLVSLLLAGLVLEGGLRLIGLGPAVTLGQFDPRLGWVKTPNAAVKQPDASGKSTNALEVRVGADKVDLVVNGTVVHTMPKAGLKTDGIYGLRVNHLLEVQIDGFAVSK